MMQNYLKNTSYSIPTYWYFKVSLNLQVKLLFIDKQLDIELQTL